MQSEKDGSVSKNEEVAEWVELHAYFNGPKGEWELSGRLKRGLPKDLLPKV